MVIAYFFRSERYFPNVIGIKKRSLFFMFLISTCTNSANIWLECYFSNRLRETFPCWEFFWSVFSRIRTEYGDLRRKSPYSVWMQKNMDQKNSEYRHFLRSDNIEIRRQVFQVFLVMSVSICTKPNTIWLEPIQGLF